jgi:hypothetical protein
MEVLVGYFLVEYSMEGVLALVKVVWKMHQLKRDLKREGQMVIKRSKISENNNHTFYKHLAFYYISL